MSSAHSAHSGLLNDMHDLQPRSPKQFIQELKANEHPLKVHDISQYLELSFLNSSIKSFFEASLFVQNFYGYNSNSNKFNRNYFPLRFITIIIFCIRIII
ncbi:hypothetical protein BpHYR1_025699 [Brachionus plicatilis]|uniref:Uncharacterized protein n=1 Tax=Brachionus plicatilis TaxID=10195 RepID=A0A3M7RI05_BRAPC|nr:hypothetical protein BpHYR1_025699 [Brachionus plicatilis]